MTSRPHIALTVPRRIERQIRSLSKREFPREAFAFLLGTVAGDSVYIEELLVPEGMRNTPNNVKPQPEWWTEAVEQARESDLTICGWFHSHPYRLHERDGGHLKTDHSQSESDLDSEFRLLISAVCVVQEMTLRGHTTLRASVRFWGLTIPVEVTFCPNPAHYRRA